MQGFLFQEPISYQRISELLTYIRNSRDILCKDMNAITAGSNFKPTDLGVRSEQENRGIVCET